MLDPVPLAFIGLAIFAVIWWAVETGLIIVGAS